MKTDYSPATIAYLQSGKAFVRHNLFWIIAKHRVTGALETFGISDAFDNYDILVRNPLTGTNETRPYIAMGGMLGMDAIPLTTDLTIRTVKVTLSYLNEEVKAAFREYDPRLAPVQIHRMILDQDTMLPIGAAESRFIGYVNEAPIERPAAGEEGKMSVSCVSHSRQLTKTNSGKRSDETQRRRGGDRFRKHSTIAGDVSFWWGEKAGSSDGTKLSQFKERFQKG